MIRVETARGRRIPNSQERAVELSYGARLYASDLIKIHPGIRPRGESVSVHYNCHGLTFACRRTHIEKSAAIQLIITDDEYQEVPESDTLPGDVVLYSLPSGDVSHSGVVVAAPLSSSEPLVCSKWGGAGEFVHEARNVPALYGTRLRFLRCER